MISDTCYSGIGRTTHQHLNNLRRQLGTGVDPAFDYSKMLELQKKLAMAGKQGVKARSDRAQDEGGSAPTSGLDLLKRTLKDVVGVGAGIEDGDSEEGDLAASNRRARSSPADIREQREANRNTSAFLGTSRNSLKKLDIENRFRAPPIGSYRPKDVMLHPKQVCHQFDGEKHTLSLKTTALNKEIERLQEEGQPFEHLTKPAVSIELQEGIPDRPKDRMRNYQFAKDLPRPDMSKNSGIEFHDNSFTAGVLDGKERTSDYPRLPSWDFAKTSTAPDKPREYFFQPGQYAVNWQAVRPKMELKNIPFTQQQARKPAAEVINGVEIKSRPTKHLPDRSLARPSAMGSCPLLERRVRGVQIGKCTTRKPPYEYIPPMYDASDPRIEASVLNTYNTFDAFEAMRATKPIQKPASEFKKSLTRLQQQKGGRSYGNDITFALRDENLSRGPVSAELLPMDFIHDKPSLQKRVICHDLKTMAGRETSKEYMELPPRGKVDDLGRVMSFERGMRTGDSKPDTHNLSKLAGAITELRGSRSYDALAKEDHPSVVYE